MILVFDIDETIADSAHRTPYFPDGTLDLEKYKKLQTRGNIYKDKLLPLAKVLKKLVQQGKPIVILTARHMTKADYDYLRFHKLTNNTVKILSRDTVCTEYYSKPDGEYKLHWLQKENIKDCIVFDDNKVVKKTLRKHGYVVVCAHKVNKRLKLCSNG